jgi:LacI family transcriptional regulator
VGVLGVNNDELLCELAFPPLSSVTPNARRAGYEAAALLDRMMRGERLPPDEIRIPPLGICCRQSTDVLAVEDSAIAQALRFIREHACDPIDVSDVLRVVPLSRRVLEQRFVQLLNRTPHAEILSVRLNRAKQLIGETKLSLGEIATRAGFEHPEYLSVVFKREEGLSPREYRQNLRR